MTIATEFQGRAAGRLRVAHLVATRFATVGDQMLVALANFWLTVAIGRAFQAEELASYGIGLSVGLMVQGLQRHAIIIPLMLEPKLRVLRRSAAIAGQHWIMLAATLAVSAAGAVALEVLGVTEYGKQIVIASGVCLIVYAELEFARAIFIKLDRPLSLLGSSLAYAALAGVLGAAALSHWLRFPALVILLAAAMLVHAACISALLGEISLSRGSAILGANLKRYGGWSLVATVTFSGYNHVPLFILGHMLPPVHAATFVATRGLMQPLQILLRGLDLADKAAFAEKRFSPQSRAALMAALKLAAVYTITSVLFTITISQFAEPLLLLTYGPKFAGVAPVLAAWTPVFILIGCSMPLESLVYARRNFTGYYTARAIGSVLAIALTVPLVSSFAESGAILACAVGAFIAILGAAVLLVKDTRR